MIFQCPAQARQSAALTAERRCAEGDEAKWGTMVRETSVVTVILTHSLQFIAGPNGRRTMCSNKSSQVRIADARMRALGDRNLGAV
jgi:hypothetical protein